MGAHVNYYWIIYYLVLLKNELHRVFTVKHQELIKELSKYEIYPHSDNDHLPNNKELATALKMSQSKMNLLLRSLLEELVPTLSEPPLVVKNCVHHIHIDFPFDEERGMTRERREEAWKHATYIKIVLPVSPSIGDEISIPFIDQTGKNYRGYVHSVQHTITGTTQEVYLEVHPIHNYYHKWLKMKNEYEYWKSFVARMKDRNTDKTLMK